MKRNPTGWLASALALCAAVGCAASAAEPQMVPAARQTPLIERQVELTLIYGDEAIAIDEVLLVRDPSGRTRLMFIDGDVGCEDVADPNAEPEGLALAADLDERRGTARWTFYRSAETPLAVQLAPEHADIRWPPSGGWLNVRTELDGLRFEISGAYSTEVCEQV
jgi:hypothetical protein